MYRNLLQILATELPVIVRQLESNRPELHGAAVQRLRDFVEMTEPHRSAARRVSRRGLLRGAGVVTFAAMSMRDD